MKNKRKEILLTIVYFLIVNLFSGCRFIGSDLKDINCQFTPDELSHLYFDRDSLVYDGHSIGYYDTISFLQNKNDTIFVQVFTSINSFTYPYDSSIKGLHGYSTLDFIKQSWVNILGVNVIKDSPNTNAEIIISISLIDAESSNETLDFPIDTALVLGKTYNDVYKIEYPENSPTKLKKIFFAKKFGFIKIEAADGRKLERLEI